MLPKQDKMTSNRPSTQHPIISSETGAAESGRKVTRKDAFELFGSMRHSTPEEQELMQSYKDKISIPIEPGTSIFELEIPDEEDEGVP